MIGQNYTRSNFDHYVYFRKLQDGSFIYLLLYVDDMLIASRNQRGDMQIEGSTEQGVRNERSG